MRRVILTNTNKIVVKNTYEGETIENKMERITTLKEPIKDGSPLIYTERKNGVEPQYDIRTDRFDIAIDAMDKVSASHVAKGEFRIKEAEKVNEVKSTQATE